MKFSKIAVIVCVFFFFIIGCIFGYNTGRNVERKEQLLGVESFQSFWGVIKSVDQESRIMLVGGIPENDINHRMDSYLTISDKTLIMDSGTQKNIKLSELKTGDSVRITYHGPVLETSPVQISDVDLVMRFK